nr:MAG TPA: hypothetical protein [Caudoviricetes sp.]
MLGYADLILFYLLMSVIYSQAFWQVHLAIN